MSRRIFPDFNASTPIAPEAVSAMRPFLTGHYGNPSGLHRAGMPAKDAVEKARGQIAGPLGCDPTEVVFTSGGGESNNHAIKGIFFANRNRGNHVITTAVEHPATIHPCRFLETLGARVTVLPVDRCGTVTPADVRTAITPETVHITVMHANNEVETIETIPDIAAVGRGIAARPMAGAIRYALAPPSGQRYTGSGGGGNVTPRTKGETMDFGRKDVIAAKARVYQMAYATPLVEESPLSSRFGGKVLSKLENLQYSGSFKIRGAANKVLSLDRTRTSGVIAASAGNHARGVARAAREAGIPATLVMPLWAPVSKWAGAQREGGENVRIIGHGETFDDASKHAAALAGEEGLVPVHPFDDPMVIAGQGTLGIELVEEIGPPGTIYVPVGGGGLLAGIGAAVKETYPETDLIAVQAEGASSLLPSLAKGTPVECAEVRTIADGIAVKSMSERTYEAARRWVDDVVVVDDEEIAAAILYALEEMKTTLEGAGAAPLAALLYKRPPTKFPAVMVLSGGNIDVSFLSQITERGLFRSGRLVRLRFLVPDRPGSLASLLSAVARERSNVVSIEHDRLPPDCPLGYSTVVLLLETRDRAHGEELVAHLGEQGFRSAG